MTADLLVWLSANIFTKEKNLPIINAVCQDERERDLKRNQLEKQKD